MQSGMQDYENLYDKIREIIGKDPAHVNILEEIIDVDLQVEYFEYSKKVAEELKGNWAMDRIGMLGESEVPLQKKKQLLTRLASLDDVKAFRGIEAYADEPDEDLRQWSVMALQESKMHIESHLLEENQVFISTGLGGRKDKLRYFVVLVGNEKNEFSDFQKKIMYDELLYSMQQYDGEIEEYSISGYLASFLILLPIQHAVKSIFLEGVRECNHYGDFLRENCIVTNVRKLSFDEIEAFIEKNQ